MHYLFDPVALIIFLAIGVYFIVLLVSIRESSKGHAQNKAKASRTNYNPKPFKNIDELRNYLIQEYMKGKENIVFDVSFYIDPDIVLELITDKRYFPFYNKYQCEVNTTGNHRNVKLTITYTQGFKIFLAVINSEYEQSLNDIERQVLYKVMYTADNILNSSMSKFEKARIVHDYLISTSSYDYENYKNNTIPDVSYTPYGVLFEHKAVCQAYAETFMIFMTLIGVECLMVVGKLNSTSNIGSDNHAWNIIKINGKYGHVDVTSDNPVPKDFGKPMQKYFFITDEIMDRTHCWKINQYPFCT